MLGLDGANMTDLHGLFSNPDLAFTQIRLWGFTNEDDNCPKCNHRLSTTQDSSAKLKMKIYCPQCGYSCSILNKTIFTRSHLPLNKILHIIYCWAQQYPIRQTVYETHVSKPTVIHFYESCCDACVQYINSMPKIGGIGCEVQIDETQVAKRKANVGRIPAQTDIWVFGGICIETQEVFATVVTQRTSNVLLTELCNHVNDYTKVVSDCWPAYHGITNIPQRHYAHGTVNHKYNFVDPATCDHTQNIERYWRTLKFDKLLYGYWERNEIQTHVAEAVWRHNVKIKRQNAFKKAIELLKDIKYY